MVDPNTNEPTTFNPNFRIWERNPVMLYALVQAVIYLVSTFGVNFDGERFGATMVVVSMIFALVYNYMPMVPASIAEKKIMEAYNMPAPEQTVTKVEVTKVD